VTLDPDVAAKLKETARQSGVSFREALNSNVRRGLESADATPRPYRLQVRRLGLRPGVDLDKALALADELEGRETAFEQPLSVSEALDYVDGWLAQPVATVIDPTDRHPTALHNLLEPFGVAGPRWTDPLR
jgi:hypothetical protein